MHTQLHRRIVTIYTHTYMTCLHTYAYTVIHMCNNMYSNNIHTYLHNRALNPSNILPEIFISTHSQNSIYPMGCNSRMPVARGAPFTVYTFCNKTNYYYYYYYLPHGVQQSLPPHVVQPSLPPPSPSALQSAVISHSKNDTELQMCAKVSEETWCRGKRDLM